MDGETEMAYVTTDLYALKAAAALEPETGKVAVSCGPVTFKMAPHEAAELARQIAVAIVSAGEDCPDQLPAITPPLSPEQMAEGDACEERR